jgi:hypothetical protein
MLKLGVSARRERVATRNVIPWSRAMTVSETPSLAKADLTWRTE